MKFTQRLVVSTDTGDYDVHLTPKGVLIAATPEQLGIENAAPTEAPSEAVTALQNAVTELGKQVETLTAQVADLTSERDLIAADLEKAHARADRAENEVAELKKVPADEDANMSTQEAEQLAEVSGDADVSFNPDDFEGRGVEVDDEPTAAMKAAIEEIDLDEEPWPEERAKPSEARKTESKPTGTKEWPDPSDKVSRAKQLSKYVHYIYSNITKDPNEILDVFVSWRDRGLIDGRWNATPIEGPKNLRDRISRIVVTIPDSKKAQ